MCARDISVMGFPAEYSGFIISKILFNAVFLLSTIRNVICWFLRSIGLVDFLESDVTWADLPEHSIAATSSVSAEMIRKCLSIIEFGQLADRFGELDDVTCAVCLNEFERSDEIRQLKNCCHIFHKNCLDKWLDHDQKTCPLCRSCLLSEIVEEEVTEESWAVERLLYLFGEDLVLQS